MTEAILDRIDQGKGIFTGYHWTPEGGATLPTNALASNILCKDHNERLSGLDEVGSILFDFIRNSQPNKRSSLVINGHDIERWMVQRAAAHITSGNTSLNGEKISPSLLDTKIISNAILNNAWLPQAGLYMTTLPPSGFPEGTEFAPIFEIDPDSGTPKNIFGSRITLAGVPLAVIWSAPGNMTFANIGLGTYRPARIEIKDANKNFEIDLTWDSGPFTSKKVILDAHPWKRGLPPKVDPKAAIGSLYKPIK